MTSTETFCPTLSSLNIKINGTLSKIVNVYKEIDKDKTLKWKDPFPSFIIYIILTLKRNAISTSPLAVAIDKLVSIATLFRERNYLITCFCDENLILNPYPNASVPALNMTYSKIDYNHTWNWNI